MPAEPRFPSVAPALPALFRPRPTLGPCPPPHLFGPGAAASSPSRAAAALAGPRRAPPPTAGRSSRSTGSTPSAPTSETPASWATASHVPPLRHRPPGEERHPVYARHVVHRSSLCTPTVILSDGGGVALEYWHVAAVGLDRRVLPSDVLGHVERPGRTCTSRRPVRRLRQPAAAGRARSVSRLDAADRSRDQLRAERRRRRRPPRRPRRPRRGGVRQDAAPDRRAVARQARHAGDGRVAAGRAAQVRLDELAHRRRLPLPATLRPLRLVYARWTSQNRPWASAAPGATASCSRGASTRTLPDGTTAPRPGPATTPVTRRRPRGASPSRTGWHLMRGLGAHVAADVRRTGRTALEAGRGQRSNRILGRVAAPTSRLSLRPARRREADRRQGDRGLVSRSRSSTTTSRSTP